MIKEETKLRIDFDASSHQIQMEQKLLQDRFQRSCERLGRKRAELHERLAALQVKQLTNPLSNRTDMLDQILERLERLEKRLDRFERPVK